MALGEKASSCYRREVRCGGLFSKKYPVAVNLYEENMDGVAFQIREKPTPKDDWAIHTSFNIPYKNIINISLDTVNGRECVVIEYMANMEFFSTSTKCKIALWGLEDSQIIKADIERARQAQMDYLKSQAEKRRQMLAEQKEKKRQYEESALTFFQNCYDFHVKADTPVYTFQSGKNEIVALYIGRDKSMNFIQINGYREEENVGTIPYNSIHYFEKAGNVSYSTDIHGDYSSYGGSFTAASLASSAFFGNSFCSYMGMTSGSMFSMTPQKTNFTLNSKIVKIDDRNIILNYYSDEKKQYVDIELPRDIYNFLQTHLPEKNYSIVEELERQAAVRSYQPALKTVQASAITPTAIPVLNAAAEEPMAAFKVKVDKLKLMKETGLLSDEEFNEERKKLLSQL